MSNRKKLNKMARKYLWIGMILLLLIGVVSGYNGASVNVENIDLGPKLDIFTSHEQEIDDSSDVFCHEDLTFKMTLTNSENYWVRWGNMRCNLKINREGYSQNYDFIHTIDGEVCISPNEEISEWVTFKTFNEIDDEDRIGYWTITPDVTLRDVSCFSSADLTEDISDGSYGWRTSSFSGNPIKIKVVKEEPTTHHTYDDLWKWVTIIRSSIIELGVVAKSILAILGVLGLFFSAKKILRGRR